MPHEISPSQIETARRCFRRWAWQSVHGFKPPTLPSAQFGTDVHAALEHRVQAGAWGDARDEVLRRAQPAFDALVAHYGEAALRGASVERDWRLEDSYPLPARGRTDLVLPACNTVVDWKSTSSLNYIKSDEDRAKDAQTLLYAEAFVREGILSLPLDFAHVWTVTKGTPEAKVTVTRVTEEMLSIGRKALAEVVSTMRTYTEASPSDPLHVEPNVLACRDFNTTCFHFNRCFPKNNTEDTMNDNAKSLIAARKAALAGEVYAPPVNPPGEAVEVPAPVEPAAPVDSKFAAVFEDETDTEAAPAKRRGRPPKIRTETSEPPKAAPVITTSVIELIDPIDLTPSKPKPTRTGAMLLLGGMPLRSAYDWKLASDWLAPFAAQACENLRVPYWGLADFGKGKQAVAALVASAAQRGELPQYLALDRRDPLADAVADLLIPHYDHVFAKLG